MAIVNTFNIGDVTLPGDGYPPLAAFQIPVTSGLVSALFLGDGASLIADDFAPGAGAADILGSPVSSAGYTALSGSSYVLPEACETDAMTLLVIAKKGNAAEAAGFIGNISTATSGGVGIYSAAGASSVSATAVRAGSPPGTTVTAAATPDAWGMYALSVPSSGALTFYNLTTGGVGTSVAAGPRVSNGTRIRVGTVAHSGYGGATDLVLSLVYNRALSTAEMTALSTWARSYAAGLGLTV